MRVFVVAEGEQHYHAFVVHAIFSDGEIAEKYKTELIEANESTRWPNVYIYEFEIDEIGHILKEETDQE
jgi:hypothetical protein